MEEVPSLAESATEKAVTEPEQVFTPEPPPSQEEIEQVVSKEAELASTRSTNPPIAKIEPTNGPLPWYKAG